MRLLRVSAVVSVLAAVAGYAQQRSAQPNKPSGRGDQQATVTVLRAQANLVLLDVVVNKDGKAAHGLTKDAFHVVDNGVAQTVSVFEEHQAPVGEASGLAKPMKMAPNFYNNFPEYPEGSAVNVLLLDALNTPLADQQYVRREVLDYLKTVPPGTPIAVFTLASQLRMMLGFTTDAAAVAKVLTGKGGPQTSVVLDPQQSQTGADQMNQMEDMQQDAASLASFQLAETLFQQFDADLAVLQTDQRVGITMDALQSLARYLKPIPGRKNLIWFSGSFPLLIQPADLAPLTPQPGVSVSNPFQTMRSYEPDVRATDGALTAARVAVYPVDARGLTTAPTTQAANSYASPSRRTGVPAISAQAAADQAYFQQTMLEKATMNQIAEETGGEAFLDTNGIKQAMAKAVADGSNYYTIGYSPGIKKYDGTFHKLKVTLDGKYQTAYRQGYFAEDLAATKANPVAAKRQVADAFEPGAPPVSEILFEARVKKVEAAPQAGAETHSTAGTSPVTGLTGGPRNAPARPAVANQLAATEEGMAGLDCAAKGQVPDSSPAQRLCSEPKASGTKGPVTRYAVDYGVATAMVNFSSLADGLRHARVEFTVIGYGTNGKPIQSAAQIASFDLKPDVFEEALRRGISFHQEIDLPPGQSFLRIAVRDLGTDRVGAMEVPLLVGK